MWESADRGKGTAQRAVRLRIGHACGHNLIAAGALGAFLALGRAARASGGLGGTVELIGTPAEEGGGGKIRLLDAGMFAGVDAAMMYHPYDRDLLAHPALATTRLTFTFRGAPAHAAIAPWDGQSALTACLETFRLIDAQARALPRRRARARHRQRRRLRAQRAGPRHGGDCCQGDGAYGARSGRGRGAPGARPG
jgi:metal-dependent amidase/aminoacylase/carboxypeptidase family protein